MPSTRRDSNPWLLDYDFNVPIFPPESIVLEDLERVFEDGGEESRLSNSVLKLCLSHPPCRDCHSLLSGWLMSGRLAAIELHHVADHQVRHRSVAIEIVKTFFSFSLAGFEPATFCLGKLFDFLMFLPCPQLVETDLAFSVAPRLATEQPNSNIGHKETRKVVTISTEFQSKIFNFLY